MTARSRSHLGASTLVLAVLAACVVLGGPSRALAERVVLYPVTGNADPDRLDQVGDALEASIRRVGHTRVPTPGGIAAAAPTTSAQMEGIGLSAQARYVVVPSIEPLPGQYRLHLVVGHDGNVEELLVNVLLGEEAARLDDVLRSMLRPEGLGEDALRLSGIESDEERAAREARERAQREAEARAAADAEAQRAAEAQRTAEEEERRRAEEAAQHEREAAEQAAREAAERQQREQDAWEHRPQLGSDGASVLMIGVLGAGLAPVGTSGPQPMGGTVRPPTGVIGVGVIQARFGHALEGTGGLELRGGLDVMLGGTSGIGLLVGASYQLTPFALPLHLGAVIEVGVNFLVTGPQDAGFVGRLSAIASWAPIEHLSIEVSLPELGYLSNGPGAVTFGASARVGYRF